MSWKVEVEPPEDMDETHYDIDPNMKIWKKMTGAGQEKEDLDELYHPSVPDLLKVQLQNLDTLPAADIQSLQKDANSEHSQVPEEDKDDVYHPDFSNVASEVSAEDRDEINNQGTEALDVYLAPLIFGYRAIAQPQPALPGPEVDMDDLYHADIQQPVPYQVEAGAAAPVGQLPQKYSEPEEDLDDLYH